MCNNLTESFRSLAAPRSTCEWTDRKFNHSADYLGLHRGGLRRCRHSRHRCPERRVWCQHPEVARIDIDKQAKGALANLVTVLINKPLGLVGGQAEDGHEPAITLVQPQNRWTEDNARFFFHDDDPVSTDVQSVFPADKLKLLRHGLSLDGQPLKHAKVEWQNPEQLRVVLSEGKKRQIRRMCELVGLKVVGLKRVRIGNVMLGHLPVGQWRYLAAHERF